MDIDVMKLEDSVRRALAKSATVQRELLELLSKDPSSSVRRCVASNPITPSEILDALSRDGSDVVRFEVTMNENTHPETLANLALDKNIVIKRSVARNKKTMRETLKLLSNEPYDFALHYFVAMNENTPEKIRKKLKENLPKNTWSIIPDIKQMMADEIDDD